jgi:hypothetical protein
VSRNAGGYDRRRCVTTSGSNRFVADVLNRAGLGTLLFDLLSPAEAAE